MACGRKEYNKLKQKKEYKDIILLLKADDESFWTYDEDAVKLVSGLYGGSSPKTASGGYFHCTKDDIHEKYTLRHLVRDAYKAVPRSSEEDARPNTSKTQEPEPIPIFTPEPPVEKSCDICILRINETCTEVRPRLCDRYRAAPPATKEEKEGRRSMGDASGIAQGIPWYKR